MTHMDVHEDAQQSPIGTYHEFLLRVRPNTLHMFVEGLDDPSFYGNPISPYLAKFDDYEFYSCGGKRQVFDIRKDISERSAVPSWWTTVVILYFVDRDLSDLAENEDPIAEDTFVTDYYSFENYLVSEPMLKRVFHDFLTFHEGNRPSLANYLLQFDAVLAQFYEIARPVMIWGIFHKRISSSFTFDSVKPSKLFDLREVDGDIRVVAKYGSSEDSLVRLLDRECKISTPSTFKTSMHHLQTPLSNFEPKTYTRGKYELWVMLRFMDLTVKLLRRNADGKYKFRYILDNLGDRDAAKMLAPRLHPVPATLAEFLARNLATNGAGD